MAARFAVSKFSSIERVAVIWEGRAYENGLFLELGEGLDELVLVLELCLGFHPARLCGVWTVNE